MGGQLGGVFVCCCLFVCFRTGFPLPVYFLNPALSLQVSFVEEGPNHIIEITIGKYKKHQGGHLGRHLWGHLGELGWSQEGAPGGTWGSLVGHLRSTRKLIGGT